MPDRFSPRPRRSALYMPASNVRAIAKARTLPVDTVILDLEDAVAPAAKLEARRQAIEAVQVGGFGSREIVIRINALDTEWGSDDLLAVVEAAPDAILVPKVQGAGDIAACQLQLDRMASPVGLWAMIETCTAILNIAQIAACAKDSALACLVLGTNDLAKEIGIAAEPASPVIRPALAQTVIAARAYGLTVLDGVSNDFEDEQAFTAACALAVAYGFDGKTLIHPRQIDICNRAFAPSVAQLDDAARIVAAFAQPENAGRGAIRLDGRMVELLHLEQARAILARG
ncbi:HpcH/HpaI aldolase/citrate lyase family protein [Sphingomonas endolithica]|uniref:HpcH/HpaI aldolase/citrate lyase family protein n=1 Tax=Sphingomonas endolithica TaxID=2972485 RepID=UPI0021AEEBB3|nr:CoA ester lyase [Sphingomonas sp. ZFBP2030]